MGRTLPTIIQLIHFEEETWKDYRRALRKEDRELFDELWRYVRHYAVSAQMASRPVPFEALLFSMILGVLKELKMSSRGRQTSGDRGRRFLCFARGDDHRQNDRHAGDRADGDLSFSKSEIATSPAINSLAGSSQ
jgi:hypothetical protein